MAFIRPWDNTFPPDTQQANLLGQDIRRDKEDTAERIRAFGGGLIASRETPEADFGNANIGALFFAEDEGKLYRWNGSAWNRIFIARTFVDAGPVTKVASGVDQDMLSVTIPANFLVVGDVLDITFGIVDQAGGGGADQRLSIAGFIQLSVNHNPHASIVGFGTIRGAARIAGSTVLEFSGLGITDTLDAVITAVEVGSVAVNLASAIVIKSILGNGGSTFTHRELIVRVQ